MEVSMVTGIHYLGVFIGDPKLEKAWLDEKVKIWMDSAEVLAGVARRHLQTAYAGLKKSLQ